MPYRVRALAAVVAVSAVTAATGCTPGADRPDAAMTVSPPAALLDEPVAVSLRGLPPGARTTVTATATDADGVTWTSSADFEAGGDGTVRPDQPPVGGSWSGADPMGLLAFMTPADPSHAAFVQPVTGGYDVTLRAALDGDVVATATARRRSAGEAGVTARELRPGAGGIHGTLFTPAATGTRRAAVLLFGGSDGGLNPVIRQEASLLAARGHPSLALAYFKAPGLPATLTEIPLEYFARALAVLRAQPGVDPDRVVVLGGSRGGEAALLLGATFPDLVDGVVARVPGSYVNSAIPDAGRSPWTLRGRGLPHAGAGSFGAPAAAVDPRAVIPVERIRGPILLTCGELDLLWPSCSFVDDVTGRLRARRSPAPVTVLRYPDGGHFAGAFPPYTSINPTLVDDVGGTVASTQQSSVEFRRALLALLAAR